MSAHHTDELLVLFKGCDRAIRHTRGVATGIAVIDRDAESLTYAGVGSNRLVIDRLHERSTRLVNAYGIVGAGFRGLRLEQSPFEGSDIVVLASDGIRESISVADYSREQRDDVQHLADRLLDDWTLDIDDASVMVYRRGAA